MKQFFPFLALVGALSASAWGQHKDHSQQPPRANPTTVVADTTKVSFPDITVLDQEGRKRNFYRDLVKGKTVAVNFVFTTCTTICPPLGATFAKVQTLLGERAGKDIQLISISVDPMTDTPERLKAWQAKFSLQPGWTLVTGGKAEIDQLLKAMGGFSARKEDHTPIVLIGNETTNQWTRAYGLTKPSQLVALLEEKAKFASLQSPAQNYFTDVELINQHGEQLRFYSDLIKDHIVIINAFFTTCTSVCPPMNRSFARLQDALGDRLGKDVLILSLSVDAETDTPERLREYAARFHAKRGWHFLTGKKENVEQALRKLGQYVSDKNDHLTIVLIGNDRTGLWKKAHGLAQADALRAVVESVVNDKGPAQAAGGK
jgi:protein SCO1